MLTIRGIIPNLEHRVEMSKSKTAYRVHNYRINLLQEGQGYGSLSQNNYSMLHLLFTPLILAQLLIVAFQCSDASLGKLRSNTQLFTKQI